MDGHAPAGLAMTVKGMSSNRRKWDQIPSSASGATSAVLA